jgi:GNAT superfamily N-acetyltransferase
MTEIRPASPSDVPRILDFIRSLAEYEKLLHEVEATEALLHEALFGQDAVANCLIGELGGEPVGFALYFRTFSTFLGKPGLYLEDLFVEPEHRGRGVGKALLVRLAQIAHERGYGRVEWSVLDWNAPSIAFYESLGAKPMDDWTTYRLAGDALADLAR